MSYKNRIIGSGVEDLDQIQFNPRNWRIHPLNQQDALKGVLEEVGWVQEIIINQRTGNLIDGHLRCQLAAREGAKTIPVKYVDLSEEEEALILSTLDPIAGMAATDRAKLDDLMRGIQSDNEQVQALVKEITDKSRFYEYDENDLIDSFTEAVKDKRNDVVSITLIFDREDAEKVRFAVKENGMKVFCARIMEIINA